MEKSQAVKNDKSMNVVTAWLLATRPKTLTAALVPFLAGTMLAWSAGANLQWSLFYSALLAAFCIQIGTNFINDAFDFKKGADTPKRLGPQRGLQSGILTHQQVYYGGMLCFAMALLFGIPLIVHGGLSILFILMLSVACGYLYTGGPAPLAYVGLGDAFVVIFFGWVSTAAAYWLQKGAIDGVSLLLGAQIGLLCAVLIAINNLRDVENDGISGKKTLAVRFGIPFARGEISMLIFSAYILNSLWFYAGYTYAGLLPWLTLPLGVMIVTKVWLTPPSQKYNAFLGLSALLHLSFGLLLILGFVLK